VRAVAAYCATALALITAANTLEETLGLAPRTDYYIALAALLGLPFIVVASWLFELQPDTGINEEASAAPPPHPPESAPDPADSLPTPGTAFIGRRRELSELVSLLTDAQTRLATVLGPGGTGKTRLALSAAREVAPKMAQGARYIALSALPTHELLAPAIAESLGLVLSRRDDVAAELLDYLREKELLLILDNFDDLIAGAPLVGSILEHAPRVRVLVTSRERLNLIPEVLVPLDGLATDTTAGADSEAVELFVAAARRQDRSLALDDSNREYVQRICDLVGGLPLAIELAAAWVRVMSPQEIHQDLARSFDILSSTSPGLPARHRSMRATFESSWRLLTADEQRAVARLSVIRSDFDRDTAMAVAGADVPLLRSLLDKSFLTRSEGQFLMLDVVRQYALERLRQDPDEEQRARRGHLQYFADLLESLEYAAQRWDPKAFARVVEDMDDVRAAWSYAVETADAATFVRTANTLYHLYDARGWAQEGAQAFSDAAQALNDAVSNRGEYRLAHTCVTLRAAALHHRLGRQIEAEPQLRRGLASARELGNSSEIVFALHRLGGARMAIGDYEEARRLFNETLLIAHVEGNQYDHGWSLAHLGSVALADGHLEEAARLSHEALALLRGEQDRVGTWVTTNNLAVIAALQHRPHESQRRFDEALAVQRELGNQRTIGMLLHNLGCAALDAGDLTAARQYLEEALDTSERMGYQGMAALSLAALGQLYVQLGDLSTARGIIVRSLRMSTAARNYPTVLEGVIALAQLRLKEGDREGAAIAASLVASHPAAGGDGRELAQSMLKELHVSETTIAEPMDLAAFIDGVIAGRGSVSA
jgi:predicted ATPase/Tfp pilus assembly protein PilF